MKSVCDPCNSKKKVNGAEGKSNHAEHKRLGRLTTLPSGKGERELSARNN